LYRLRDEMPRRAAALAALNLPETLLHGDLWSINVFVIPTNGGLQPRLIDWDHAGVGPFTYDLSTLLVRFPAPHRAWMLDLYRQAVAQAGWALPPLDTLNLIIETHEFGRYANSIIWPAIDIVIDGGVWGFESLEEIDGWFETFDACSDWDDALQAARPGLVHPSMTRAHAGGTRAELLHYQESSTCPQ
jgi:Phosphotransferase enzyme family